MASPPEPAIGGAEGHGRGRRLRLAALGGRALWVVADQVIFSATSFGLAIGVARQATTAEFGAFGIAYVVYTLVLGTMEAFTAEVVVVRGSHLSDSDRGEMLARAGGTAVAGGLGCSALAVLALVFAGGGTSRTIGPIFILAPLLFVQDVWRFGFFAAGRPRAAVVNDGLWALLFGAAVLLLGSGGPDGWIELVWSWSGAGAVCGVVGAVQSRCLPRPGATVAWVRDQARAGARFGGEYLALYGAAQAVLIMVGAFTGLAQSAGYRGGQLLFGPVQVMLNAVRLAVTPLLVRAEKAGQAATVRRGGLAIGLFAGLTALAWGTLLLALPRSVGERILGSSWPAARPVMLRMWWLNVVLGLGLGALVLLRVAGAYKESFRIRTAGALLIVGLGGVAATQGSTAAATGVAVGTAITVSALWRKAWALQHG